MLTRPRKANCCWRGLRISPLCWRSWTHPTAGLCQFPGRGQAAAVGLIWQAKAPPWLEVVRLKAAVFPPVFLRCRRFSSETNGALSSVIFAVSFAEPPQERQTRQQQKSSSPDRQKVRFFFFFFSRCCLWQKTQLCCFLGFLRSPLREPTQFWIKFFNSHWNGLNQIPGSRFQIPVSNTA